MPVTFDVDKSKTIETSVEATPMTSWEAVQDIYTKENWQRGKPILYPNARVLLASQCEKTTKSAFDNGVVGAAFLAYNEHHHLVLRPDDIWVTITTSLARYIDKHAEKLRHIFVEHEGKKELQVYGGGTILTANYDSLLEQMGNEIRKNTKQDIAQWMQCDFTTSTIVDRTVSLIVLMGAMKNYFKYKMYLYCGLPRVTLEGTIDDWKRIRERIPLMKTWKDEMLSQWADALDPVLAEFVNAFEGKVDTDFWNKIAFEVGGGSGPRHLSGWMTVLLGFDSEINKIFYTEEEKKSRNGYGMVDTNDVPSGFLEVPVIIDDNGKVYHTNFVGGCFLNVVSGDGTIRTRLDWALVDLNK